MELIISETKQDLGRSAEGSISPAILASVIRKHEDAWLFLDKDSASMLA